MGWTRTIAAAVLFLVFMWLGIRVLETIGSRGLAGPIVQNNLRNGTDATGLFYTEIDPDILGRVGD